MPARLYFKFLNQKNLVKALTKLRCLEWENDSQFSISYWEEARSLPLGIPYDGVPEEIFPILLAKGKIVGAELLIDVRSFQRAVGMIKFLYMYLGPDLLYVTHIATYNRRFAALGETLPDILAPDKLFSDDNIPTGTVFNKNDFHKIPETAGDIDQLKFRLDAAINQPLPVIQKMPVTGTKQGLDALEARLLMNMVIAKEHWDGNTTCSMGDIIHKMVEAFEEEALSKKGPIKEKEGAGDGS